MATQAQTRSGSGLRGILLLVGVIAVGWVFVNIGNDGSVIFPQFGDEDDQLRVVMIVSWSHPVEREVTTTYWINGERHAGLQEASIPGQWREWFDAPIGTEVRVLAENVGQGGRLSCFIYMGPPGDEIPVRDKHRTEQDAGDCDIEHRVGDPPNVDPLD